MSMPTNRKHEKIDLYKMYLAKDGHYIWNLWLTERLDRLDIKGLQSVLYGINVGMDDLVKQKLNHKKIIIWYIRLQRSIEDTMKSILRIKYPNPNDNPGNKDPKWVAVKRKRDGEFELFLRGSRF